MNFEQILKDIPDKRQDKDTTSLKFKKDLIEFFGEDWKDKTCLEIGTNRGYTTRILSFLFKKVITCEYDSELVNFAKNVNKDRDNIEFLQKDVYQSTWDFENIDVSFIDCVHEYANVMHDIQKSLQLVKSNKEMILVFDDYGLPKPPHREKDVKDAVDQYVDEHPSFDLVKYIGEDKGSDCRPGKILKAEEGVICKYRNIPLQNFYRILDNELHIVDNVAQLGFEKSEGLRIPDEYLDKREFMVMRTAHGIGDWGIISAMPRLLKEKYSDCKVYVPSKKLLKKLFGKDHDNVNVVFDNNPFVDEFVDEIKGDVFHDHYRIYDKNNPNIPLIKQMLEFWDFTDKEMMDSQPEMYWSFEEQELGNSIIREAADDSEFGCLLISDRFGTQYGKHHQETYDKDVQNFMNILTEYQIPYFYYTAKPIEKTEFNWINKLLDMRHIDLRVQLYIKSRAKINLSNQCGTNQMMVRYSKCFESQRQFPISHNFVEGEIYL
tara:strand:+ start:404 stop:1876 length:1473 start_codon:yes stop_codon:yes gene_type:complete